MEPIKKSTLDFLTDLKSNNNRDWFIKNRKSYDDAKTNFESFAQAVINEIVFIRPYYERSGGKELYLQD